MSPMESYTCLALPGTLFTGRRPKLAHLQEHLYLTDQIVTIKLPIYASR